MNKKIILIGGYLAGGKSTFARALAKAVGIPCFIKDTFKIALCSSISIENRELSSQFSAVTFDGILYAVERLFEAGFPVIIEGNFLPAGIKKTDEAGMLRGLMEQYGYRALTFQFTGDTGELYQRFVEREGSPERGDANRMFTLPSREEFDRFCHNMDGFHVGGKEVVVDTTTFCGVDFHREIEAARRFLEQN